MFTQEFVEGISRTIRGLIAVGHDIPTIQPTEYKPLGYRTNDRTAREQLKRSCRIPARVNKCGEQGNRYEDDTRTQFGNNERCCSRSQSWVRE